MRARQATPLLWCIACTACDTEGIVVTPQLTLSRMIAQSRLDPFDPSAWRNALGEPPQTVPASTNLSMEVTEGMAAGVIIEHVPLTLTTPLLERGRNRFDIFCATCHGLLGDGVSVVARYMRAVRPRSLHDEAVRLYPAGRLFRTIRYGYGLMPAYAMQLTIDDTWAVVAYVKALQLSQRAKLAALPDAARSEAEGALP
jgi:mono/diheme cytochrome c family protein